jgi:hypothetical protein
MKAVNESDSSTFDTPIVDGPEDSLSDKVKPDTRKLIHREISCAYCGSVFQPLTHNARFCSYACRREHKTKRAKAR